MEHEKEQISVAQICKVIDLLDSAMNDCLYVLDMRNDYYYISPKALTRFSVPSNAFHHVVENHAKFVYPDDIDPLQEDLRQLIAGEKDFHNMEYRWKDIKGNPVWINCRGRLVKGEDGRASYMVGCINEIGVKPKADNLSGLLGEASLQALLEEMQGEELHGFFMRLGIDGFKEINEKHGVEFGDMILQKTAKCISECLEPGQRLYRIVADEFAILDLFGGFEKQASAQYRRIRRRIDSFIEEMHYDVMYTISAGILDFQNVEHYNYPDLMRLSEFALNEAKRNGRNCDYRFRQNDYAKFIRKRELAKDLRKAVYNDYEGFEAYLQPLFANDGRLYGAEALMRFESERWGLVSPVEFIPILEETGLIIPVGKWMLHEALEICGRLRRWIPDFRISVNVSYVQVIKSDILKEIVAAVEEHGLLPENIIIEITESGLLETDNRFTRLWSKLKENGIRIALDDFGTGYSNFHYLYELRPDIIKIDRSFTAKAMENDYEYTLLSLMSGMIHKLNLKFCVEGIETREEHSRVKELFPDYSQGFYFGKPCPYSQFVGQFITNK